MICIIIIILHLKSVLILYFSFRFPCRYKHETSILMRETGKKSVFETYLRKKVELEKLESTENKEDSKPSES